MMELEVPHQPMKTRFKVFVFSIILSIILFIILLIEKRISVFRIRDVHDVAAVATI